MSRESVWRALGRVYDPELDEPVTELGFVRECAVGEDGVEVVLRLPTPQCAPNFAFLMASDARREIELETGTAAVTVRIEDHCTEAEINSAVAGGEGFTAAFPGETTDDELASLRSLFQRKALVARQAGICETMLAAGTGIDEVVSKTVAELPPSADTVRSLELRAELGIDSAPGSPGLVSPSGETLEAAEMPRWLRMARLVRTSLEANGGICRSLLLAREADSPSKEAVA